MENKIEENIVKAKIYAKDDYDNAMVRINAYNPNFKREWREVTTLPDKTKRYFALTGTPDKAFVIVDLKTGVVKAYNQARELIKTFK